MKRKIKKREREIAEIVSNRLVNIESCRVQGWVGELPPQKKKMENGKNGGKIKKKKKKKKEKEGLIKKFKKKRQGE